MGSPNKAARDAPFYYLGADAEKHPHEKNLIRRVAGLLNVPHPDFIDAKTLGRGKSGG